MSTTSSDASADAAWEAAMRALARGGSADKPAAAALAPNPDTPPPPPSASPASAPARGAAAKQQRSATPAKPRSTTPAAGPRRPRRGGRTPPTGTLPLVLAPGALTSAARAAVVELPPGVDPGPGSGAVGRVAGGGATLDIAGVLCDARPFARAGTLMAVALTSAGGAPSARVDGVWTRAVAAVPRAGQVDAGGGRHVAALEASDDSDAPGAAASTTPRPAKGRGRGRGKKAAVKKKRAVKPKAAVKKKAAPKKAAPKKARK